LKDASCELLIFYRQEAVNYIGFYTSHEQLMQQLIMEQAASARCHIETMVKQGAVHCRTHLLWTRLMCPGSSLRSFRREDGSYRDREREVRYWSKNSLNRILYL